MSGQKKKNFQIEAFKHHVVIDPKYAEKTWKILDHAIHEIYNQNASGLSFEELYRNAYNMVLHKFGEKLYSGLVVTMSSHLKEMSKAIEASQGGVFLEELDRKWADHNKALQMIRDIVMYMDRTFVQNTHKTPVHELGLNLWRDHVVHSPKIQTRLLTTVLDIVQRERGGEVINRGLMRNVIKMLVDLGPAVYQEDFERPFLEASAEFYRAESQRLIEVCECGEYLKRAEKRLAEETDRVTHYLDPRSEPGLTGVVEREMIEAHMERLVHMEGSGLVGMLEEERVEELGRMYGLMRRVPEGLGLVREVMTGHVRETGRRLVTEPEGGSKEPGEFVQRLLDEKGKYDGIIGGAFGKDKGFQNGLNSAFEEFVNLNGQAAELISLYVDEKMRKGLKGATEEEGEGVLDKVMMLFRYLEEKDVFEKYYRQHLAKRLLSGKSVSDELERSLIVKLKTECGYQFTAKLEGMFTDMKTSEDTMKGFEEGCEGPGLQVQVLTTGSWPTQGGAPCNLPAEVAGVCERFRGYYLGTHTGRRLTWQTGMGTADVRAVFDGGQRHELKVSTHQMCVLMMFNGRDRIGYGEVEQGTGIPGAELRRCLQALACTKGKNVLRKEPVGREVGDGDVLVFNGGFASRSYKVKIGTLSAAAHRETEPEKQETRLRVEEDRKPQIEAALVRLMKSRRLLDHNNLVAHVTRHLQPRFLPNPLEIKKRIESLIERDFLERDPSDRRLYRYLA